MANALEDVRTLVTIDRRVPAHDRERVVEYGRRRLGRAQFRDTTAVVAADEAALLHAMAPTLTGEELTWLLDDWDGQLRTAQDVTAALVAVRLP